MTTLDTRLYAWLLESNERRFELAFKAYFEVAYPSVMRHLARMSRWDPSQLEELAQDALLRFFDKVGRNRRAASDDVSASLMHIRPLSFGSFQERQVINWGSEVGSFRESAMGFCPRPDDAEWKTLLRTLAEKIPMLQGRGEHLLHAVHLALEWSFDDLRSPSAAPAEEATHEPGDDPGNSIGKQCEQRLIEEMRTNTARAAIAQRDHPGSAPLVLGAWTIICALPHLRVPTNSYLFEIAGTIYLDECKKRGRQKRGGTGATPNPTEGADLVGDSSNHPIERLDLESFAADESEERFDDGTSAKITNGATGITLPSVDPTSQYENEDLFEKFYEYLRRPVDDAIEAFNEAATQGRAAAERRRLDSLTAKFSRAMSVLSVMGEGYTQDETAQRLGLSRNQVKYIIELVQETYAHFSADSARHTTRASAISGASHVV